MLTIAEGAMYEAIHVHTLTFLHVFSVRRLLCLLSKVGEPAYAGGGGGGGEKSDVLSHDNITCRLQSLHKYTADLESICWTLQLSSTAATL